MPELYGQPRKDELRQRIRELSNDLHTERKEHRRTRKSLEMAQARIALLTKKIQSMEGKLKDLLAEASQEISFDNVWEEIQRMQQARYEAIAAEVEAETATAARAETASA